MNLKSNIGKQQVPEIKSDFENELNGSGYSICHELKNTTLSTPEIHRNPVE